MIKTAPQNEKTPREGRFYLIRRICVAFASLLFLSAWLLSNHYPPWYSFHSESLIFFALILFSVDQVLSNRQISIRRVWWGGYVVILIIAAQCAQGLVAYVGDAAVSILYIVAFCFAYWLGVNHASRTWYSGCALLIVSWLFVSAGFFSTWIAFIQWLGLESPLGFNLLLSLDFGARPYANLGQPNHLATLLLISSGMVMVLLVQQKLKRWQGSFFIIFFSFGLALAGSRAAWLSAMVFWLFFLWFGRRFFEKRNIFIVTLWVFGVVVAPMIVGLLSEKLLLGGVGRVIKLTEDNTRLTMWLQFVNAIFESPWFGYGWRQTAVAQKVGAVFKFGSTPTDYAHNVFLDLFLWVGIPLGGIFFALLGCFFIRLIRRTGCAVEFCLLAMLIPVVVHSVFEFPFSYSYFLMPVAWILGFLSYAQNQRHNIFFGEMSLGSIWWNRVLFILFVFFCGIIWRDYINAEEDYRVMRFELRSVGRIPLSYHQPQIVVLTQLKEMLTVGRWVARRDMQISEINRLDVANRSFSWAALHLKLVVSLALNGQVERASKEMNVLRAIYGEISYAQAADSIRQMMNIYPELKELTL